MNPAKFQTVHAASANAPRIISVLGDYPANFSRTFYGVGAPTASTLLAGNGKYNAAKSGYITSVQMVNAGTGYAVGDTLNCVVGAGTASQVAVITVDAVQAGVITDWHISTVGVYSVYSVNPVSTTTGGGGSGATFNLNFPAADYYLDMTSTTAPVLYICGTSGSNSTSVWAIVSGGGNGSERFRVKSVQGDYLTCRTWDGTTEGGTDIYIAKPPKLRHSVASESIEGATVSYAYSARANNEDGKRVATSGAVSQTEIVIPVWIDNDEIFAAKPLRGTDVIVSSVELEYLDLNVDGRVWCKVT